MGGNAGAASTTTTGGAVQEEDKEPNQVECVYYNPFHYFMDSRQSAGGAVGGRGGGTGVADDEDEEDDDGEAFDAWRRERETELLDDAKARWGAARRELSVLCVALRHQQVSRLQTVPDLRQRSMSIPRQAINQSRKARSPSESRQKPNYKNGWR